MLLHARAYLSALDAVHPTSLSVATAFLHPVGHGDALHYREAYGELALHHFRDAGVTSYPHLVWLGDAGSKGLSAPLIELQLSRPEDAHPEPSKHLYCHGDAVRFFPFSLPGLSGVEES